MHKEREQISRKCPQGSVRHDGLYASASFNAFQAQSAHFYLFRDLVGGNVSAHEETKLVVNLIRPIIQPVFVSSQLFRQYAV